MVKIVVNPCSTAKGKPEERSERLVDQPVDARPGAPAFLLETTRQFVITDAKAQRFHLRAP
jgi:hypothetical protein